MKSPRILVIGGGPAGLAAAIRCRLAGIDTMLVRERPAGDGLQPSEALHPGIERLLTALGVPNALAQCSRGTYRGIWVGESFHPLGEDERGPWLGHHVDRQQFDGVLLSRATELGVDVIDAEVQSLLADGYRVVGARASNGADLWGTLVVDATGKRRFAARSLNIEQQFFSPPLLVRTGVVEKAPSPCPEPTFTSDEQGWIWLAPEASGNCTWTRLDRQGHGRNQLPDMLRGAKELCVSAAANVRWRLHERVVANGVVMVGDAAGVLDPAAGQGVLLAVWSGIVAAQAIDRAIQSPIQAIADLDEYNEWYCVNYRRRAMMLARHYSTLGINLGAQEGSE